MKSIVPTKLQRQIVDIVSSVKYPFQIRNYSNTSGRCVTYWVSGQRLPRDIVTIEDVLDALGYELLIRPKGADDEDN